MNCQEFLARLDAHDSLSIPPELETHARGCAACRPKLDAARRMGDGLAVVRGCVRVPDLAARIRQTAGHSSVPSGSSASLGERLMDWWMWLAPTTPMKSTLFYGASAAIIFLLCWTIVSRVPPRSPAVVSPAVGWTLAMDRGAWPSGIAVPTGADRAGVAIGQALVFAPGAQGRLVWPGRAVVSQLDGRVTPLVGGFRLEAGEAYVRVEPTPAGEAPFQVETPFARVTVVGTAFRLALAADRLDVEVTVGRVRVQAGTHEKTLGSGERVAVDAHGWVSAGAVTEPSDVEPHPARPEVPED